MDRVEELLRSVRHAPQAPPRALQEVTRRGRRRRSRQYAAVAASVAVVTGVAVLGVGYVRGGDRDVVTAAPSTTQSADAVVVSGAPISWARARVDADGRTIVITFSAGDPSPSNPCYWRVRPRVEESADSVTVTLEHVTSPDKVGTSTRCLARLYTRSETVALHAPLGERRLVDGATGAERAVTR